MSSFLKLLFINGKIQLQTSHQNGVHIGLCDKNQHTTKQCINKMNFNCHRSVCNITYSQNLETVIQVYNIKAWNCRGM